MGPNFWLCRAEAKSCLLSDFDSKIQHQPSPRNGRSRRALRRRRWRMRSSKSLYYSQLINECPASLAESAIALLRGRICRRSGPSDQRSVVSISKADQSAGATSCAYSNLLTIDKAMWAIPSKTWSNRARRVLRIAVPQPRDLNLRNERLVRPECARAW